MNLLRFVCRLMIVCLGAAAGPCLAADAVADKTRTARANTGMYSNYIDTRSRFFSDGLRETYPIPMDDLVPALMDAINHLSKYAVPVGLPSVHRVPHDRIEALTCGGKCAALAVYRPGEGIYLDAALQPETDVFARSVLLHELIHYVQDMSNELVDIRPCERWYRREQEAYAIQKRFLMLAGSQVRVGYSAGTTCDPNNG